MEPWLSFYKPHFPSQLAAEQFVEACEKLEPSGANHVAKIMMHRGIMFRGFFATFLSTRGKDAISYGFTMNADRLPRLGFSNAVDLLYDIRCDVVHEGNYTDFAFHDGQDSMVNTNPDVIAEIRSR